jgi:hypothetical protein
MKPILLFRAKCQFAILALLIGPLPGTAQNWSQWSTNAGGNNHYYALTPCATNWTAAEKQAVAWGGALATITSSNEQNFINQAFLKAEFEHRPLWIGLVDPAKGPLFAALRRLEERIGLHPGRGFHWVTGERFSYNNWKPGEPNNTPPGENYVAINWEFSANPPRGLKGDWNDTPLNGTTNYGGKTDGPYFGLVERETDPSQPVKTGEKFVASFILITALIILLLVWAVRRKRSG